MKKGRSCRDILRPLDDSPGGPATGKVALDFLTGPTNVVKPDCRSRFAGFPHRSEMGQGENQTKNPGAVDH